MLFFSTQVSLLVFWISLLTAGILRGLWRMDPEQGPFAGMMLDLEPVYWMMFAAGVALAVCLSVWAGMLLRSLARNGAAGGRGPEAGGGKPAAGGRQPEAGDRRPEAGYRRPEAGNMNSVSHGTENHVQVGEAAGAGK
jgi:hypothetical protein